MNSPSYWLKKPSPMAAPKLAMAGKQAAQPIAETTLPSAPVLPAMRVMSPALLQIVGGDKLIIPFC
ncbi:Uncharacterised protein [Salmonella enterica subsp. enterica serovar Typhi]|nr:Uncharacterised protein [Salmonella enterica subsp. enterica serovar Typhi]